MTYELLSSTAHTVNGHPRRALNYEVGYVLLDPMRRFLASDGNAVALRATLSDALLCLVEHSGRVVSREELLDEIGAPFAVHARGPA